MDSTKNLRIVFTGDTASVVAAFDAVQRKTSELVDATKTVDKQTANSTESQGTSWLKLGTIIGAVAGSVQVLATNAIMTLESTIGDAVRRVDTLNNAARTFENMGFATSQVNQMMTVLTKSILGLPTSLDQAVSGVELLAGSTNDILLAQQVFSAINDAVIGFGGSAMDARGAVIQLSQALSNGKIDAQTWNSLIQNGMGPALDALARSMGTTIGQMKNDLSSGKMSASDFEQGLINLDKNGGGGMKSLQQVAHDATSGIGTGMENAKTAVTRGIADVIQSIGSKNISEAISKLGKTMEDLLKDIAGFITSLKEPLSVVGDVIKTLAGWFTNGLKKALDDVKTAWDNLKPSIDALWHAVKDDLMPTLKDFMQKYGPDIKQLLQDLAAIFGATLYAAVWLTINAARIFLIGLSDLMQFIDDHKGVVTGLAIIFGTLAAAMAFTAVFNALTAGFATLTLVTIPAVMAAFGSLVALITAPIVMPAIAVGAALAALDSVRQAALAAKDATDNAKISAANEKVSDQMAHQQLLDLQKNGTPDQKARASAALKAGYSLGGFTGIGRADEVAGVVHKGEYVLPASQVDQVTGQPKASGGGDVHIHINVGNYGGSQSELQSFARQIYQVLQREARSNGMRLPEIGVTPTG